MIIKKAVYKTSVVKKENILNDGICEFAFVGRSNVGKSTLINSLVGIKGIAKTSATPGKTKMINYFDINDSFRFVDLPGYGFAKVGKETTDVWSSLISEYLLSSSSLACVFVLLDARHLPSAQDKQMLDFLIYYNLPFKVIVTKTDKLAKSKVKNAIKSIADFLKLRPEIFFASSGVNGEGKKEILDFIEQGLEIYNGK